VDTDKKRSVSYDVLPNTLPAFMTEANPVIPSNTGRKTTDSTKPADIKTATTSYIYNILYWTYEN